MIEAIVIEKPALKQYGKMVLKMLKRDGLAYTLKVIFKKMIAILIPSTKQEWFNDEFYYAYSDKVNAVNSFNSEKCETLLKELNPDLIVLGGSGIIRKNIIAIPTIGILNAHPGLLPKYRGVDTVPWALYHGDTIGATVHFIDEGVDTGKIISQSTIDIADNDTINGLREKAWFVAAKLMAETLLKIVNNEPIQTASQSKEDGKQYYKMPKKLLRETEKKLSNRNKHKF